MPSAQVPACVRIQLKPGSLARVREWAAYIAAHREDALRTLQAEGVSVESVFLESSEDGDFLVYYMRTASLEKARAVAVQSTSAIDQYHQRFKRECWAEVRRLELLVDIESCATRSV